MAAVPLLRATCSFNSISSITPTRLFLPSSSLRLSSSNQPFLCLRERSLLTPFAASTSEWAQQEEEEKLGWVGGDSYGEQEGEEGLVGGESFGSEETYTEPSEEAKLYVGNLPFEVDSEGLAQLFDQAGVVDMAEVIYNRQTDRSRGFGFVTMRTVEEAEKAVEMLSGYEYNGRPLTVNKAAERGSRPERRPREFSSSSLPKIYIGNLAWETDDTRLMQVFSKFGKVVNARVVSDRETGRSRGFGFVTMSTQSELDNAISSLDGQTLDGRTMRVSIAEERPRRF